MKSMKDQYGDKKGEAVFYASANKGKIKKRFMVKKKVEQWNLTTEVSFQEL